MPDSYPSTGVDPLSKIAAADCFFTRSKSFPRG